MADTIKAVRLGVCLSELGFVKTACFSVGGSELLSRTQDACVNLYFRRVRPDEYGFVLWEREGRVRSPLVQPVPFRCGAIRFVHVKLPRPPFSLPHLIALRRPLVREGDCVAQGVHALYIKREYTGKEREGAVLKELTDLSSLVDSRAGVEGTTNEMLHVWAPDSSELARRLLTTDKDAAFKSEKLGLSLISWPLIEAVASLAGERLDRLSTRNKRLWTDLAHVFQKAKNG